VTLRGALLVAGLLLLAGGLRLLVLEAAFPVAVFGDERYYLQAAASLARGEGYAAGESRASWPPGQSFFLSLFLRGPGDPRGSTGGAEAAVDIVDGISPGDLHRMQRAEVALGALLVLLTAGLGRALFDARTGLAAGCLAAVDPTFVAFSHYLWSETLFAVLFTAALLLLVEAERRQSALLASASGLLFGAAALTREVALPIALACAVWWGWGAGRDRRRIARALLPFAVAALVVLPWSLRNYALLGRVVPISTVGSFALREGNTLSSRNWMRPDYQALRGFRGRHFAIRDELERADQARAEALALIRNEQPWWILKKTVRNLALLFSPDSLLFYKLRKDAYGPLERAGVRGLLVVAALAYGAMFAGSICGIAAAPAGRIRALPLIFAPALAIHIVANSQSRYRLPLMPLLMVYASYAVVHARELRRLANPRRLIPALLVLLFFAGVCVPHFLPTARALWRHAG
jgi:4-amino-4-deoxy-L-arabinose transferase-like glycosyltransferase